MQHGTKTHKIHTDKQINLRTVKWAQCVKTQSRELAVRTARHQQQHFIITEINTITAP